MPCETEQALSDAEQTASDRDQVGADRDQLASDRDQAASDRHLAAGGDVLVHALTRDIRRRNTYQRQRAARARLDTTRTREANSRIRDVAAVAR